ncbi:DUF5110 domain-containing protein [candidate division KSB1 bacterium]|nr:MAG: DUF5110 domain-containing protein [candidate division KSB1 bacterium]
MKTLSVILFALIICAGIVCAEEMGNMTFDAPLGLNEWQFAAGVPKMTVTMYADNIIKVSLYPDGLIQPDTSDVVTLPPGNPGWLWTRNDSSMLFILPSGGIHLNVSFYPLRLAFGLGEAPATDTCSFFWNGASRGLRKKMSAGERIYGGGERALPLNRRGQLLTSYNSPDYCYGFGAADLSITIPFLLSSRNWGIYFDDPYPATMDIGNTSPDWLKYTAEGGRLSFYFIAGNNPASVLEHYTELTGRQPLPPLWALGYLQSRFGYHNVGEARALVNAFRNEHIPLDAIILDLYWFGWGQMGDFDWDYSQWPDPADMMRDFDSVGVKTILITEPYILQSSSNYGTTAASGFLAHDSTGQPVVISDFWAGSAGLFDVTNPAAADWWWSRYNTLIQQGVGGWWSDLGEPEAHPSNMLHYAGSAARVHNVYSLLWAKRLYEGYRANYPNVRLFNLIRSGYAGMQRYGTFPWSGDVQRQYEGLQAQIPILLSMGLSGVGYMGSDLGGFACGPQNPELYIRWMQFGAFCPVMRAHGVDATTEPVYFDPDTRAIVSDFIRLRYALLPYNYTLAYENAMTGMPLARPLFFEQSGQGALDSHDEYMWGSAFLVAPMLEPGSSLRMLYLPEGTWFDFFQNCLWITGERWYYTYSLLDRMLLYVKAGSFVPMIPPIETTRDYNTDTLIVHVYPDPTASSFEYTLYNDDGVNPNAIANGLYETIGFTAQWSGFYFDIHLEQTFAGWTGVPATRKMIFCVHGVMGGPASVTINDCRVPWVADQAQFEAADTAYFRNSAEYRIDVGFLWNNDPATLRIAGIVMGVKNEAVLHPSFALHPCYPNPFNACTTIRFSLPRAERVKLIVYDVLGRQAAVLTDEMLTAGEHARVFDASGLSSGLYFCCLTSASQTATTKLLLIK